LLIAFRDRVACPGVRLRRRLHDAIAVLRRTVDCRAALAYEVTSSNKEARTGDRESSAAALQRKLR